MKCLALVIALAACSGGGSSNPGPTSPAPADPAPTPVEPAPPGPPAADKYGTPCGDNDACPATLECVKYYGIAGARGPQFKTCEQRCDGKEGCPTGLQCNTIADGPGQVCRP